MSGEAGYFKVQKFRDLYKHSWKRSRCVISDKAGGQMTSACLRRFAPGLVVQDTV